MGRKAIDLTGYRFGNLTVIRRDTTADFGSGIHARWICRCSCGCEESYSSHQILSGAILQHCNSYKHYIKDKTERKE